MKLILALILLGSGSLYAQDYVSHEYEMNGDIKEIHTQVYDGKEISDEKPYGELTPKYAICNHFSIFDKNGQLLETSYYDIIEPVDELGMGYCDHSVYTYSGSTLVSIDTKLTEKHDLGDWEDDTEFTRVFEATINGDTVTSESKHAYWTNDNSTDVFVKGKRISSTNGYKDFYYFYDAKGLLVKEIEANKEDTVTNTWTYSPTGKEIGNLHVSERWMNLNGEDELSYTYSRGNEKKYYANDNLFSDIDYAYRESKEDKSKKIKIIDSENYYNTQGRDSIYKYHDIYSEPIEVTLHHWEYEFHSNGQLKSSRGLNGDRITGASFYNEQGLLTKKQDYNIHGEMYTEIDYEYNNLGLIIKVVNTDHKYDNGISTISYEYDTQNNWTKKTVNSIYSNEITVRTIVYY